MGAVLGVLIRNYGFTDLPPSLPLPRSDPVTRISESSYRRGFGLVCELELYGISTFDSESFELELNGRAWDTSGLSFVQIRFSSFGDIRFCAPCAYTNERTTLNHSKPCGSCPLAALPPGASATAHAHTAHAHRTYRLDRAHPDHADMCNAHASRHRGGAPDLQLNTTRPPPPAAACPHARA